MSRKTPPLGLSWPYRKTYTLAEMVKVRCRFDNDGSKANCERVWREYLSRNPGHTLWARRRVPVNKIFSDLEYGEGCSESRVARYMKRRRSGGRFPPVVVTRATPADRIPWAAGGYHPTDKPWIAKDGNHRVRAAQCVGDQYIDAFVPVKKPPRKR